MADVHEDKLKSSLSNLEKTHGARVDVPEDRQFYGFDAFKKAIAQASAAHQAQQPQGTNGNGVHPGVHAQHQGRHQAPDGHGQPDYGAPAGWHAPGWPPPPQQGQWYPPPQPQGWGQHPQHGQQPHPAQQPYPAPTGPAPHEGSGAEGERNDR